MPCLSVSSLLISPSPWLLQITFLLLVLLFVASPSLRLALAATPTATNGNTSSSLLAFKQSVSSDPTGFLSGWNTSASDYCSWSGVLCSRGTVNVTGLLLDSKHFNGSIAPQLGDLPHLAYLNLSGNGLTGSIPLQLGNLVALTHLDLNSNFLTGTIPVSLANCTLLQYLDLSKNSLSGTFPSYLPSFVPLVYVDLSANRAIQGELPPNIGLLSNLQFFQMYGARITGQIPPSVTNCTNLVWLDLSDNELSGIIPRDWNNVPSLQHFNIYDNGLFGSLPPSLGNCTMLTLLDLQNNSLTGVIPDVYGKLTRLREVRLYYNNLSGIIPPSIANWTSLTIFEVAYNNLSGSIPQKIGQLTQVLWLSFTNNSNLGGSIPDSIGNCAQLAHLTVATTGVGGNLPKSLFNLTGLIELNLDSSRFSGTLSEDIGKLTSLQKLHLNYNYFHGQIPKGLGNLKTLQGLELAGNNLTGSIPADLAGCAELADLDLSGNSLSGMIPSSLGQLQFLNYLHLHENLLFGNIPENFGNLTRLQNLTLGHNMLTGSIPYGLANLRAMNLQLDLSFNYLTGTVPSALGSMAMVQVINLAANNFSGEMPGSLGDCSALQVLILSENRLDGTIPETFGNLKNLQYLDLSHNELTGNLPPSLGLLTDLVFLNVSSNQLQGQIPAIGVYRNSSPTSFLGNSALCGTPLPFTCGSSGSSRNHTRKIVSIAAGSAAGGVFLVAFLCVLYWCCWLKGGEKTSSPELISGQPEDSFDVEKPRFKAWTAKELRELTNNFDVANVIGTGSVSVCYKATTVGVKGKDLIAIKKLNLGEYTEREARRSFVNELKTLCRMRHRNLVKVLGYCVDAGVIALVLEFMEMGTVDEHLHGDAGKLSWDERLNVAVDVAEGLVYLHHEYGLPVIHCDLKPKNILLGSNMVARIADFGIARLLDGNQSGDQTTSSFRGTFGYVAPEYADGLPLSTSADVYSYGVLLTELVTGLRPNSQRIQDEGGVSLTRWARAAYESGKTKDVVDMHWLVGSAGAGREESSMVKEAEEVLSIALKCSKESARERPSMRLVRDMVVSIRKQRAATADGLPYPDIHQLLESRDASLNCPAHWMMIPTSSSTNNDNNPPPAHGFQLE